MGEDRKAEATCPLCGGAGSVERIGKDGGAPEVECPLCRGRGKVDPERVRTALKRLSARYPLHGLRAGYAGRLAAGGRLARPFKVLLPLSMLPQSAADDIVLPGPSFDGIAPPVPKSKKKKPDDRQKSALAEPYPEEWTDELEMPGYLEDVPEGEVELNVSVPEQLELDFPECSAPFSDGGLQMTVESPDALDDPLMNGLDYPIDGDVLDDDTDYDVLGPGLRLDLPTAPDDPSDENY